MKKTLQESLTKEYLSKLSEISLRLRHKLSLEGYVGNRRTNAKGSSLEFSDFREYEAGDDLRRVDWNSYARFGKLYLKLFMEEKQATINIFLDCSRSMEQDGKFLTAKQLAASLAYIGMGGGDRVQLFLFRENIFAMQQNLTQQSRFPELVRFLDDVQAEGKTELLQSVTRSSGLGCGISIILSDFMTEGQVEQAVKILQQKKQEVLLLQVLSMQEVSPATGGAVRLVDAETGETRDLDLTAEVVAQYQAALKRQQTALYEFCRSRDASFAMVDEQTDVLRALYEILQ